MNLAAPGVEIEDKFRDLQLGPYAVLPMQPSNCG